MSQQLGLGVRGRPKGYVGEYLNVEDLDKFADDQIVQLYELMKATTTQDQNTHDDNAVNVNDSKSNGETAASDSKSNNNKTKNS